MPTRREDVLVALFNRLQSVPDATVRRNEPLPEKVPLHGLVVLRDGDPGEPEIVLSPLTYLWTHRAVVEVIVGGATESFNGRMRDELLNEALFFGLDHARQVISKWRHDYNTSRPHSSLDYQTPAAFAAKLAATGQHAVLRDGSACWPVDQPTQEGIIKPRL